MVEVSFIPDDCAMREDKESYSEGADASSLIWTFFIRPVRIQVNGQDLLQRMSPTTEVVMRSDLAAGALIPLSQSVQPPPSINLPILHVATVCIPEVIRIPPGDEYTYKLPIDSNTLRFKRFEGRISIYSTVNNRTAVADTAELIHALLGFAREVRTYITDAIPEFSLRADL